MNPIDRRFAELRARGETALIPYLTVGDPDPAVTVELLKALQDAGADMIELGVPFSDPLADGPVIQRASARALARGTTLPVCLETARKAREAGVSVPLILFTYFNPALQMGLDLFFRRLADYDISGVILPDLPVEEDEEVAELAERYGIHRIPLVAPTSRERIARIVGRARGFVYCVSSLGVTGMRTDFYRTMSNVFWPTSEARRPYRSRSVSAFRITSRSNGSAGCATASSSAAPSSRAWRNRWRSFFPPIPDGGRGACRRFEISSPA